MKKSLNSHHISTPLVKKLFVYQLSPGYPNYPTQKWNIRASFHTYRKKFRKLQEAIWLTVNNEIFKFPPHFDPFGYVKSFYEFFPVYSNYPTQKWNVWASFQTCRKRLCKLQEAIWLTVVEEIFKFSPHFYPFGQETICISTLPGLPELPNSKMKH